VIIVQFEELMKYIEENKEEHFQDIICKNELMIKKIDEKK